MYEFGRGVAQDHVEALRLYHLAAAQGLPQALIYIAGCPRLNQPQPL
jgi:TPR repeat protein